MSPLARHRETDIGWSTSLTDLRVDIAQTARGPIEVARAGRGPAVVLVHGTPGSWRQAIGLAEDLDGFEVLLVSRPGFGRTPLRSGRTFDAQADLYAALLDAYEIGACSMVGLSGGGASAAAFAARHRRRTSALILLSAMAARMHVLPHTYRVLGLPRVGDAIIAVARALVRRRMRKDGWLDAGIGKRLTSAEHVLLRADRRLRDDLVRVMVGYLDGPIGLAGMRSDQREVHRAHRQSPASLARIDCPTLVLHGAADETVAVEQARFHASAIPGAELVEYEQAGHALVFTHRTEVSSEVRRFLRRPG